MPFISVVFPTVETLVSSLVSCHVFQTLSSLYVPAGGGKFPSSIVSVTPPVPEPPPVSEVPPVPEPSPVPVLPKE